MHIQKKSIIYTLLFVFVLVFSYIVITAFSYNVLDFTTFYQSKQVSDEIDEDKIIYTLNSKNEIVYLVNDKDDFFVYKIKDNNIDPELIASIKLKDFNNYGFINSDEYHFIFYNNDKGVIIIDELNKKYNIITDLPEGKKIINHKTNKIYNINNNILYVMNDELLWDKVCEISNEIKDIKKIEFINSNELVIATYNGKLFVVNINDLQVTKLNYIYHEYYIANEKLYYTYSTSDRKIGICIYDEEEESFVIEQVDYLTIKVKTDYLYLIASDRIYKVSLTRKKQHETLQVTEYIDSYYSLSNILIVNDQLIYLPMIKKEDDDKLKEFYGYYLYRYKVV